MKTEAERDIPWPPAHPLAEWVGYLCVAPVLLGLAGVGLLDSYGARELAQRVTLAWGGTLLAFTGAVHWGLMLAGRLPWQAGYVAGALAPLIVGAAAVVIGGQRGLALLVIGFGGFWLYEHRVRAAALPHDYVRLRRQLSLAVCTLFALTMFVSDTAGLT